MSVFTAEEIEYLRDERLARIATVGRDGRPHIVLVTYRFNEEEDAIDVGGVNFGASKKWRDVQHNAKVTFLLDDVIPNPRRARALEVRGDAELHATGGEGINPRFPNFAPEFFRLRPRRIVSWGLEEDAKDGRFRVNSRTVG